MNFLGMYTLFYKELLRFGKVALQTIIAPIVIALLYLLVFSHVLEGHVNVYDNVSYTAFLVPGLIMMSIIQNAFANSSSSLLQSKVTGNIIFGIVKLYSQDYIQAVTQKTIYKTQMRIIPCSVVFKTGCTEFSVIFNC